MALTQTFMSTDEQALAEEFLSNGYVIRDVEDRAALAALRHEFVIAACKLLEISVPADDGEFLDNFHQIVSIDKLNNYRLGLYRELNGRPWFRPTYFKLARKTIEALVGNELAMQNRINLSIQMPNDHTSLLDIHADVFTGETPYQVVEWLPLVDVKNTKAMFILPKEKSDKVIGRMKDLGNGGMPALFQAVKQDLIWLDIPFGKVLVFSPNVLHGNVVNEEPSTRWSLNTRFTGLLTPYGTAEKALGSYYLPITTRPVTRVGMEHRNPAGFEE
jgi:sporadic carbohydrate cluster 2OG-Fe(II) oxygenase